MAPRFVTRQHKRFISSRNGMLTGKTCLAGNSFVNLQDCGEDIVLAAAGVVSLYAAAACSVRLSVHRSRINLLIID
jgi:hypothetical protein